MKRTAAATQALCAAAALLCLLAAGNGLGHAAKPQAAVITSPSKSSIRVLESQQALTATTVPDVAGENDAPRRITVVQIWDGTDYTKRVVSGGLYTYQVQAKLMAPGKNGPLTRATSWKRRGRLEVR